MANQFLVEMHEFITHQTALSREALEAAQSRGDGAQSKYCAGQLDELHRLRAFLSAHFDLDTQTYY